MITIEKEQLERLINERSYTQETLRAIFPEIRFLQDGSRWYILD